MNKQVQGTSVNETFAAFPNTSMVNTDQLVLSKDSGVYRFGTYDTNNGQISMAAGPAGFDGPTANFDCGSTNCYAFKGNSASDTKIYILTKT